MKNVVIIDYKLSNLFSVNQVCKHIGLEASVSSNPFEIQKADAIILPGVGAFQTAMSNLNQMGLTDSILEFIHSERPFFGVCLGLQLLFTESVEFGSCLGLNLIDGKILKFPHPASRPVFKVPQIGWNSVHTKTGVGFSNSPMQGLDEGEFMYFVHSFYAKPENGEDVLTTTNYCNIEYCSGVLKNNIFAVQFHPEKSGEKGVKIYENWARLNNLI